MAGNYDTWKSRNDREGEEPEPERESVVSGYATGIEWLQEALHAIRDERTERTPLAFWSGMKRAEAVIEGLIAAYRNG